jgi:hypothetical protein
MPDQCRFCLSEDYDRSNPLISPCNCTGSVKFVHSNCLNHWRTVTQDINQKVICQLCHAPYNLPRRWLMELTPIPDIYWNYFLSQSFVIIILVHYLHLLCITQFTEFRFISQDPHVAALMLQDKFCINSYYALLGITTFTYYLYYVEHFQKVINKRLYFYFGAVDIVKFLAGITLCLYLIQYTIFPCGGIFIYLLSHYFSIHLNILQKINAMGAY